MHSGSILKKQSMMNFLKKMCMSMVMSRQARENYEAWQKKKKPDARANKPRKQDASTAPAEKNRKNAAKKSKNMPPEGASRAELIRHARNVHKEQQHILDDLPPEKREKLRKLATEQFLGAFEDNKEN